MVFCDICARELVASEGVCLGPAEMRGIIQAGYNAYKVHPERVALARASGQSEQEACELWVRIAFVDTIGWTLCDRCLDEVLPYRLRAKESATGIQEPWAKQSTIESARAVPQLAGETRRVSIGVARASEYVPEVALKHAAELSAALGELLSEAVDYWRNCINDELHAWHFSSVDGKQFITRYEGGGWVTGHKSIGTVIQGVVPCTIVIKDCSLRFLRSKRAFLPLLPSPEYLNNFDASKVYKKKLGWNQVIEALNADSVLEKMLQHPNAPYGLTDYKKPFECHGQLVPQGDVTLAAMRFVPANEDRFDGLHSCVMILTRIASILHDLPKPKFTYGPASPWEIMHLLRDEGLAGPGRNDYGISAV